MEVEIIRGPESGSFSTTITRTTIPQGKKLEQTRRNLCSCLGIRKIYCVVNSGMSKFYRLDGPYSYQSASNTILELSEKVAELYAKHDT